MTTTSTPTTSASQRIIDAVTAWPGVATAIGERGELSLRAWGDEVGHLHGDRVAHFGFPRDVGTRLREEGRVQPHPVNRHSPKLAARALDTEADVEDAIALMRINYDRIAASTRGAA